MPAGREIFEKKMEELKQVYVLLIESKLLPFHTYMQDLYKNSLKA